LGLLNWLLMIPPVITILLVSLVISVLTIVIYKYTTNQTKLKSIQDEQKHLRDEMKKQQKNPDKVMKMQKRAMDLSMEIMPESMKSMIFTFIPVIIVFGWLSANFAYMPLAPGEMFTTTVTFDKLFPAKIELNSTPGLEILTNRIQDVTGTSVSWQLKGSEGEHTLTYNYGVENYTQKVLVTTGRKFINPVQTKQRKLFFIVPTGTGIPEASNIQSITVDMKAIRPLGRNFNLFGWYPGWLSIYIISSIIFSMLLRKYMKVY
jgi:uncharacterized membrane protein (DUF106 family)